jgi:hypothetical protein
MIALDVGLAAQHLVDPEEDPLDLYVPHFDLLFGSLIDTDTKSRSFRDVAVERRRESSVA